LCLHKPCMKYTFTLLLTVLLGIAACKKEDKAPPAQTEVTTSHNFLEADKPFAGKWYQKKVLDTVLTQFNVYTTHTYTNFTSQDYMELKGVDYTAAAPVTHPKQCELSSRHGINKTFWAYDDSAQVLHINGIPKNVLLISPTELVVRETINMGAYTIQYTWYERSE
jgi:hypothetical protein